MFSIKESCWPFFVFVCVLCLLRKALWVLYLLGYHLNLLHQNAPEPSRTRTLQNSRSCPGPRQDGQKAATMPRSKKHVPRSLGPADTGTNLVDLSSISTGKCSDLRIILRPNWQAQPRHDNPLQARPVARFLTFPIGLPHKSEGTLKRPQPIARPSNRRRCWKWPAVTPDNGRLIDCFLNFHCHITIS